jgi:hypothetical protein
MPNWCNNNIEIHGPIEKIKAMYNEAVSEADDETGLLNYMMPMPKELHDTTSPSDLSEEDQAVLIEKHGATNWYDWRVSNWSTKWEVSSEGLEFEDNGDGTGSITGWFDSAWAPPIGAVAHYGHRNEDVSITLDYHEPGMAFVGRFTVEEGIDDDTYYDYGDCNSKTVRDVIGEDMDDNWGISDMMSEWEEENEKDD